MTTTTKSKAFPFSGSYDLSEKGDYFYGLGRRKRATAQVRLYTSGKDRGKVVVNGKEIEKYMDENRILIALRPLRVTNLRDKFFISVRALGGGVSGQAGAISLGIARALLNYDDNLKKTLRDYDLLTRDAREKERKKAGLLKARKDHQYTKR